MDLAKEDQDLSFVRDRPRKRGVLPCGSRVCLRCHRQCGVVLAAYLSGLDEKQEIKEEDL
jgi:hypothetical protein